MEARERPRRRQEARGRALGIEPRLHRPALDREFILAQRQRLARGDAQLPFDEILAGDRLSDRMLYLQPGVHLHEPDAVGRQPLRGVSDELDGAGADIADGLGGLHRRLPDSGAGGRVHAGRGRLLDHLLVAALQRAVALEQVDSVPVRIGEHLHLDVTRAGDIGLQQHTVVAETGRRLASARAQRRLEVGGRLDLAHALAAAAGNGLDQHRIADGVGLGLEALRRLVLAEVARRHRHARRRHPRLGGVL